MSITTKNRVKREFGGRNSGKGFITHLPPMGLNQEITQADSVIGDEGYRGFIDRLNYEGDITIGFNGLPEGVTMAGIVNGLQLILGGGNLTPANGTYNCEMVVTGGEEVQTFPFTLTVNIGE